MIKTKGESLQEIKKNQPWVIIYEQRASVFFIFWVFFHQAKDLRNLYNTACFRVPRNEEEKNLWKLSLLSILPPKAQPVRERLFISKTVDQLNYFITNQANLNSNTLTLIIINTLTLTLVKIFNFLNF